MIATVTKQETTRLIDGPVGKLELITAHPLAEPRNAWGIVCHPHSLFGGTMHNKVVITLAKTFQHLGLNTVRFNFRGVGKSEGEFDRGNGELDDLLAVIDWVQRGRMNTKIWLAGFSFGAYVAAKAATQIHIEKLVTIALPVLHFPVQTLPPITCTWILVQGERDDVVLASDVFDWVKSREPKPIILRFPEAGHFFHGLLAELRTQLQKVLE